MDVEKTEISGVLIVAPKVHGDHRGYFTETYNAERFAEAGINARFVQDNESFSAEPFTLRGLHMQGPPVPQAKLIRVLAGAIRDVVVDVRPGSPTYGQHIKVDLKSGGGRQVFMPAGCLHGFVTLESDTRVVYKVDGLYSPESELSVRYDDPSLAIDWGVPGEKVVLSVKDAAAPAFEDVEAAIADRLGALT